MCATLLHCMAALCGRLLPAARQPANDTAYYRELARLQEKERQATGAERDELRRQHEQLEDAHNAKQNHAGELHFFIGAPIGIVVTLIGSFVRAQAIGGGLLLGGIFTFTAGCAWYWGDLPPVGRFLVLLVAFGVLMWIGYQRLSELRSSKTP